MTDFEAWAFILIVYGSLGMIIIGLVGKCYEIIHGKNKSKMENTNE